MDKDQLDKMLKKFQGRPKELADAVLGGIEDRTERAVEGVALAVHLCPRPVLEIAFLDAVSIAVERCVADQPDYKALPQDQKHTLLAAVLMDILKHAATEAHQQLLVRASLVDEEDKDGQR